MSLINQMLKDLERRHASAQELQPLAGEVRAVSPTERSSKSWVWGALLLALAAAAVGGWWYTSTPPRVPPSLSASLRPPSASPPAQPAASTPAPQTVALGGTTVSVPKLEQPMAEEASSMTSTRSMTGLDHRLRSVSVGDVAEHNATVSDATPPQTEPPMLKLADKPSERPLLKPVPASPTMPLKRESPQQRSENLYRQAVALLGQGCVAEARTLLYRSLEENTANHHARQLLAGLLLESQQLDDALPLLKEGVRMAPDQTGLVMALARLQADAGDYKAALQTMEQGAAFAGADDADFAGLHAALLQREERHAEAIPRYLAALHGDPANVSWLVGLGISLEAENRRTDAREAYERAKQTGALPPELSEFVEQRLQSLKGP